MVSKVQGVEDNKVLLVACCRLCARNNLSPLSCGSTQVSSCHCSTTEGRTASTRPPGGMAASAIVLPCYRRRDAADPPKAKEQMTVHTHVVASGCARSRSTIQGGR